ncbi:MAG: ATP-binding protein [Minisyncoccia bacterium]
MNKEKEWYVITGGPCSGKTTLIENLEKMGYSVMHEVARSLIESELRAGKTKDMVRSDDKAFQKKLLRMKMEAERNIPEKKIVFLDTAIPDSIPYFIISGINFDERTMKIFKKKPYKKIFLLEQLPLQKEDNVRIEDDQLCVRINRLIYETYSSLGYEIINIPILTLEERTRLILGKI